MTENQKIIIDPGRVRSHHILWELILKLPLIVFTNWVTSVKSEIDISNCIGSSLKMKFLKQFC